MVLPNGLIINPEGQWEGRQHDLCTMLYESGLLNHLQWLAWFNNQSLLSYVYPIRVRLETHYLQGNLTRDQRNNNKATSVV